MLKLAKPNHKPRPVKFKILKLGDTFTYDGPGFIVTSGEGEMNCMHLTKQPGVLCKFYDGDDVTPTDFEIRAEDV